MIHNMMTMITRSLHQQGRYLRRQVFDLALTLVIVAGGMLLFLATMIVAGMTLYAALRPIVGNAGALAIITAILLIMSVALGVIGYSIQSQSDRKYQRALSRSKSDGNRLDDDDEFDGDENNYETRGRHASGGTSFYRPQYDSPPLVKRTSHSGRSQGGPSAQTYGKSQPPDELDIAKACLDMAQKKLDHKLDVVRRYPVASVSVAAGLGLLLGKSKNARRIAKSAAVLGSKMLLERYLKPKK